MRTTAAIIPYDKPVEVFEPAETYHTGYRHGYRDGVREKVHELAGELDEIKRNVSSEKALTQKVDWLETMVCERDRTIATLTKKNAGLRTELRAAERDLLAAKKKRKR